MKYNENDRVLVIKAEQKLKSFVGLQKRPFLEK
jgi:hypothetical protein